MTVNVNYIQSFSDVALAAEAAQAHIANGADILTGTAQMVVGATGVAAENGAKWFGTQSNQTSLGEDMVVASQVYKWEVVLQGIVNDIISGDLGGEAHDINLGNGGLAIEFNDGVDAGAARAIADAAIAAVTAGGIDTTYVAPQPTRGGTLVQASTQVGNSINHGLASGVGIGNPSSKIFASLVHLDPNWQPQPYLAESWEVSEDGLTVTLHLVDGVSRRMEWPALELFLLESTTETDVLVLHGPEPDHEWRGFAEAVVGLCRQFGVQMVVGFGAYPAAVPHTRPTRLSCTAGSADLTERLDFVTATVEVPAGAQAVIEMEASRAGISAIGLWAQVPHYLSATSYPPAALALLAGLAHLSGATVDEGPLSEASLATRARLDDLVARNPEHVTMLEKLEAAYDDLHDVRGQLPLSLIHI